MNYRHLRGRTLINYAKNTKLYQKDEEYQQVHINLLKQSYNFKVFKYATRSFTITANNSSYKFNIYFIKETSSLIRSILEKDPHNLQYNLTTENGGDIIKRLELLFLGEKASFSQAEEELFYQVIDELKMSSSIGLRKPNSSAPPRHDSNFKGIFFNGHRFGTNGFELEMNLHDLELFLSEKMEKTFTILTKSHEYKCNIIGVNSSKLIREFLIKNPDSNQYEYDFDDKFEEFNSICQFFNFQKVEITVDNMDSLKEIAEDLQIDINIDEVDKYIDDFEQRIQVVDDKQSTINSINELFDNLNKIKEITVENVKRIIVDSIWCKTEENVLELAALILQVIQTNNLLHPYLVDLIESLGKESDKSNKLEILIPCISKKLLDLMDESKLVCNFVYFLHKRGFIQKEEITEKLNEKILNLKKNPKTFFNNNNSNLKESYIVFLPEILEIVDKSKIIDYFPMSMKNFINSQLKDECKDFKQIRDKGEPNDQITKSLREDDITTFQRIVTMNQIDITKKTIEFNIFEKFDNLSYIDYAAAYGSIQCFKYLLLNHADLNESSFKYAVYGGNIEIIKTINDIPSESLVNIGKFQSLSAKIIPAIETHRSELYVWIFENEYTNAIENGQLINEILISASKNGDLFSIANITDKGYDFAKLNNDICHSMIINALRNGFFKLLEFISTILHEKIKDFEVFDSKLPVSFGNLSIFKISHKTFKMVNIYDTVIFSIENKYESIIKYIFDNILDTKLLEKNNIYDIGSKLIQLQMNDLFIYMFEKLDQMELNPLLTNHSELMNLISESCYKQNVEITKILTELIIDLKEDFTPPFYNAAIIGSSEICQYFIDKKVLINFDELSFQIKGLSSVNKEVFDIIIKNSTQKAKETFVNFYLDDVIKKKNKVFLEYLLKENAKSDDALIEAVTTNDIEIVNMILDHNSKPSFINRVSNFGSAFNMAVASKSIEIVKRLLSIPGINPNFYDDKGNTPLMKSIICSKLDIAKLLIECDDVDINHRNFSDETALTEAVNKNFLKIVDLLINNKKFDPIESRINYAFSISDDIEIATKLASVKGFDVNLKSLNTSDLISNDMNDKKKKMLKFQSSNDLVSTPLLSAIDKKKYELIDIIINHPDFDPDKSMLNKAIFKACKCNTEHILKLLKVNNDVNIKDENGQFLLEAAINARNMNLIYIILNSENFDPKKCNFLKYFIDACTSSYASKSIFDTLADYVTEHENIIDFNHLLPDGRSFFTLDISFSATKDIINFLLKQGVDPNKPDKFGVYPLENAIKKENFLFCESLIDSGKIDFSVKIPKINDQTKYTTYLHLAAVSNNEIFSLFIERKLMDINITDSEGETPLMACCEAKKMENIEKLFEENDLDYLHCNNKGEDAFAILRNKVHKSKIKPTKNKDEYLNKLSLLLNESNFNLIGRAFNGKDVPLISNFGKIKGKKVGHFFNNQSIDTNINDKEKGKNKNQNPLDFKLPKINDNKSNKTQQKNDNVKNTKIQSKDTNKVNPKFLSASLNLPLKNDSQKMKFSKKISDSNSQIEKNKTEEVKISPLSSGENDQNNEISSKVSLDTINKEAEKDPKAVWLLLNFDKKCTAKSMFNPKRTYQGKKFLSSPLKKDQNKEAKPQKSLHKNSKDTEKDEKTLSFSFNFSKKSDSESQNEANKTEKDSDSSSSPLENNQNNEAKPQESPHKNSKDTEKDEIISSFSFNFSKKSDSESQNEANKKGRDSDSSSFPLENNQNKEIKPQKSLNENSKDTEKDEKTLSFSFNFSKKRDSETQNEANKTEKDSDSSPSPLENNQNNETKPQESPHENSKNTEKDEKTSSFSFNFSKKSDSNHPLESYEATGNSKPSPFTLKNDQNSNHHSDSSNSLDVSPLHQTTENPLGDDSSIQNEIVTSILESLDNFTPDEARRVSSVLSSIVKKEVQKITAKIDSQKNGHCETIEKSQPQNQFKFETKTVDIQDDVSKSDDQTEKKESARSSKLNDIYNDDQNEFNYLYDEYQDQMMMQQWNQIMQSNNIRNAQFNMILHQQEQMMRSLMCETKEKSSKNKHKKSKKKNHK